MVDTGFFVINSFNKKVNRMFKFIKGLFNKAGDVTVTTVTPTEKSLEQLAKEHNERVSLAYQKAIEDGKISEPVISFCDTVIENPARFKIKSVFNTKGDLFIDKMTGKKFVFSNERKWSYHFGESIGRVKNRIITSSPFNVWVNTYEEVQNYINCRLLLTGEESCYVYWRLYDFLWDYYNERNRRLLELNTERKNRAIVKERKELMGIYCKQS